MAKSNDEDHRRRCKKHPKHRQSPGVCSVCLTEKLSHLTSSSSSSSSSRKAFASSILTSSSSSSLSSYYSSASSCSSPDSYERRRYGMDDGKDKKASITTSLFKKSRSLSFVPRTGYGGFWSKLLGGGRRKPPAAGGLLHSRTKVEIIRVHG